MCSSTEVRGGRRRLGVAPLSALDVDVETYVDAAAAAGFDAIGLRVAPVLPSDPEFPALGTPRFRDLATRIADAGIEVLDVEVLRVTPGASSQTWLPALEAGHALGARYLNVVGEVDDAEQFADLVSALTRDARDAGLMPILEPVAYRPFGSFTTAVSLAQAVGCQVELDILHFMRTQSDVDLIGRHASLFPVVQLCDATRDIASISSQLSGIAASESHEDQQVAESRSMRQLPGEGDAPIHDLLELLDDAVAISIEIPNARHRGGRTAAEYLTFLAQYSRDYLSKGSR